MNTLFNQIDENELRNYSFQRLKLFLQSTLDDNSFSEICYFTNQWKENKLPWAIDKYTIQPSDILLAYTARANTLLGFINQYTSNIDDALMIIRELNEYNLLIEEILFNTYLEIQQEIVIRKNEELQQMNLKLLKEIEQKERTERSLLKEKEFSEALINNSVDGIMAFDKNFKITAWNKTLEIHNNLKKEEVIGKCIYDIFPHYKNSFEGNSLEEVLKGNKVAIGDKPYTDRNGFFEAHLVPLINDRKRVTGGICIIHDITPRKIAEDKIKSRESQLKEVQEIAHLGSWEWNIKKNKFEWSDQMFAILGYHPEEVLVDMDLFLSHVHHEDRGRVSSMISDSFRNLTHFQFECRVSTKTGEERIVYCRGKVVTVYNIPYKVMGTVYDITARKKAEEEVHSKNLALQEKNDELRKAEEALIAINNELERRVEERTAQLLIMNDSLQNEIRERVKVEEALQKRNQELITINKELDNFVYTASHDLKAPISNIEGLVITLSNELINNNGEVNNIIELINKSILKFKRTIQDLSEITKIQVDVQHNQTEVDLYELLEEIKFSINAMISSNNTHLINDFSCCGSIRFSRVNLKSILYNLITNAIKYRSPERNPVIEIFTESCDQFVVLGVKDNGLGIGEQNKEKIFSMFKRLHDHVEGSGVGLYIVKKIVENNGGRIEVESELNKGTCFKVYLKQ
ncbi:MAG: PAS domain S-box protein [Cytophagaceae bacterium]